MESDVNWTLYLDSHGGNAWKMKKEKKVEVYDDKNRKQQLLCLLRGSLSTRRCLSLNEMAQSQLLLYLVAIFFYIFHAYRSLLKDS